MAPLPQQKRCIRDHGSPAGGQAPILRKAPILSEVMPQEAVQGSGGGGHAAQEGHRGPCLSRFPTAWRPSHNKRGASIERSRKPSGQARYFEEAQTLQRGDPTRSSARVCRRRPRGSRRPSGVPSLSRLPSMAAKIKMCINLTETAGRGAPRLSQVIPVFPRRVDIEIKDKKPCTVVSRLTRNTS